MLNDSSGREVGVCKREEERERKERRKREERDRNPVTVTLDRPESCPCRSLHQICAEKPVER